MAEHNTLLLLEEVKDFLRIDQLTSEHDDIVQELMDAIVSTFTEETGCNLEAQEFTEYHDGDDGRKTLIYLRNRPVSAIASLHDSYDHVWDSVSLIPTTDYFLDSDIGRIVCDGEFGSGKGNLRIVYTAGYTSATLPNNIKHIFFRQIAHWYKQEAASNMDVASLSMGSAGGTTSFRNLVDNYLPEFARLIDRWKWDVI
jgi:uncharacterized phiE125 gp8 family phage protein